MIAISQKAICRKCGREQICEMHPKGKPDHAVVENHCFECGAYLGSGDVRDAIAELPVWVEIEKPPEIMAAGIEVFTWK